ncbi:MAG: 1-phosphofructokinase family hexose kinase [Lachnospiraceae bacterium]|nr:1-phosphofructokinase family hexose kinase [Lachnospiraceae bacterium]
MIITVTMNPAIDKTLDVENFTGGAVHRVTNVIQDAGGKGINVSKTVQALGGETIATGFLGGSAGKMIEHALDELAIRHQFVDIEGETRTNVKVVDVTRAGFVTEFNELGPTVTSKDIQKLTRTLESYAGPSSIFVFSGSVPATMDKEIYGYFTRKLKKRQATVFVDASGELFAEAVKAKPYLMKPNAHEIADYFGLGDEASEATLADLGLELLHRGIHTIAISRGQKGALFVTHDAKCWKANGIQVQAHSTVGAGDAMVAALAHGLDSDIPFVDCARLSIAASAGACTTLGTKPPVGALVEELVKEVSIVAI